MSTLPGIRWEPHVFSMIKVFNKGQVTSLALQKKKNLDTLVNYSMVFTLCNIKNEFGWGKSILSIISLTSRETQWCIFLSSISRWWQHYFCIINAASIFVLIQINQRCLLFFYKRQNLRWLRFCYRYGSGWVLRVSPM